MAMWRAQRREVLAWLADNREAFAESCGYTPNNIRAITTREAVGPDDLDRVWSSIEDATSGPMADALDDLAPQAVEHGWRAGARDVGLRVGFDVANPRAVAYLERLGARRVAGINRTTHRQLRTLLAQAVDEGWAYGRTARQIRQRFDGFGGRSPLRHIRDRAELVAVQEAADAYGHGQWMVREDLRAQGVETEYQWLDAGDERVCPVCSGNADQGWLDTREAFQSGHHREPGHVGCRCATMTRVAEASRVLPSDVADRLQPAGA